MRIKAFFQAWTAGDGLMVCLKVHRRGPLDGGHKNGDMSSPFPRFKCYRL